jgi:hypothetical protein
MTLRDHPTVFYLFISPDFFRITPVTASVFFRWQWDYAGYMTEGGRQPKEEREVSHRDIARLLSLRAHIALKLRDEELTPVQATYQRAIGRAATQLALDIVAEHIAAPTPQEEPFARLSLSELEVEALDRGRLEPTEVVDAVESNGQLIHSLAPGGWQLMPVAKSQRR